MKTIRIVYACLIVGTLSSAQSLLGTEYTWVGGTGDWSTSSKWNPSGVPVAGDTATIDSGTATVSGNEIVTIFNLNGGAINGAGTLTITGTLNWSAGMPMAGSGTTVITDTATAYLTGAADTHFNGWSLEIQGDFFYDNTARILFSNGSNIEIASGGSLSLLTDTSWSHYGGAASSITNNGTILKSASPGEFSFIGIKPVNGTTGRIETTNGTVRLQSGISGGGTFDAAAGAEIWIESTASFSDVTFSGDGLNHFTGSTLILNGTCSASGFEIAASNSFTGTHVLTGSWKWLSGSFSESGSTTIPTGSMLSLMGTNDHHLNSRHLNIEGTFNHAGTGRLLFSNAAQINVLEGGLVNLPGDLTWVNYGGAISTITNDETIHISGGGTFSLQSVRLNNNKLIDMEDGSMHIVSSEFNNNGEARVSTGILTVGGSGTSSGKWVTVEGTEVNFNGGSQSFAEGSTFEGAGWWRIKGSNITLDNAITIPRLELATGSLNGPGTLTIFNQMDWSANSTFGNNGSAVIPLGKILNITGQGDRHLNASSLSIAGTLAHQSVARILVSNAATIEVEPGGKVDLQADTSWSHYGGAASSITNNGTILKSANSGEFSFIGIKPVNGTTGRIETTSGTVRFRSGISGGGTFDAAAGAEIWIASTASFSDITFSGDGLNHFTGSTLILNGTCSASGFEIAASNSFTGTHVLTGSWKWLSGSFSESGSTTIPTGSMLSLMGANDHHLNTRHLNIEGTFNHAGTGRLLFSNAAQINVREGGLVNLPGDLTWVNYGGAISTITNGETILISGGGTFSLQSVRLNNNKLIDMEDGSMHIVSSEFNNNGEARVSTGILTVGGSGTSSGKWVTVEGTEVNFNGGSQSFAEGSTFEGAGWWRIKGSNITLNNAITIPRLELATGSLNGPGTLTISTQMDWSANSTFGNNGSAVIPLGKILTITGQGDRHLNASSLSIAGTLAHQSVARILVSNAATIEVEPGGKVDLQADTSWSHYGGAASSITNNGSILKSVSPGEFSFIGIKPVNGTTGRIETTSGTVRLRSGINGGGTFDAAAGAEIWIESTASFSDVTFSGDGLNHFTGSTLILNGTCSASGFEIAASNSFTGTHVLTGSWKWLSGSFSGSGSTTIPTGSILSLMGTSDHHLNTRHLNVEGTFNHAGTGRLLFSNAAQINVLEAGLVNLPGDLTWVNYGGATSTITNAGIIRKSEGLGEIVFNNPKPINKATGRIESMSGTIRFPKGVTEGGTFHATEGAQLLIEDTSNLNNVSFTGPGIQLLTDGDVTLTGDCTSENMEINGANILGTHALHGTWHWRTGEFHGPGTTTLAPWANLRLIGDTDHVLRDRDLINTGFIVHSGTGQLVLAGTSTLHNMPTGVVNLQSDSSWATTGTGILINDGAIYKTGQTGASSFDLDFQNNGYLVTYMGWFVVEDWIWHWEQGWIYCIMINEQGLYFYDAAINCWAWTGPGFYQWIYWFWPIEKWSFCVWGVPGERWFWIYPDDTYKPEAEMNP